MLHSVMPPEVIWWEPEGLDPPEIVADGTRRICVRRDRDGRRVITRLHSTEPTDYLDPALQPGAIYTS